VLVRQECRRHQNSHLLGVLHRFERRPHSYFGITVADVAADDPIHRDRLSMSALTSLTAASWSGIST
jgi:hypothetical protein